MVVEAIVTCSVLVGITVEDVPAVMVRSELVDVTVGFVEAVLVGSVTVDLIVDVAVVAAAVIILDETKCTDI